MVELLSYTVLYQASLAAGICASYLLSSLASLLPLPAIPPLVLRGPWYFIRIALGASLL